MQPKHHQQDVLHLPSSWQAGLDGRCAQLDAQNALITTLLPQVFEAGAIYDPKVLDIRDEDLLAQVQSAVNNVAAVSLECNYPTLASIPHSLINGYKNVLAVAVETDYSFDLADKVRPRICPALLRVLFCARV